MSDTTVTTEAPLANTSEARTPTGEIKNVTPQTTTTSTEPKVEGTTLLTESPKTEVVPPKEGEAPKVDPKAVPEKYEFKLPDGVALDEKVMEAVTPIFKEAGLTQEVAQKLMDFHTAQIQAAAKAGTDAGAAEYTRTREGWRTELAADPEIGGKLPEVKVAVGRALDALGDAKLATDFRAAMDLTGAGDNPAFVKAFYKFAQAFTEGKAVRGTGPSIAGQTPGPAPKPSPAKALYPNNP